MPKDTEKYQYFTVGLLKSSFALEALNADAAKHHMVEQPAKLIALRLTEYYDLLARVGPLMPSVSHFTTQRSDIENGSRPGFDIESDGQFTYDLENEHPSGCHPERQRRISPLLTRVSLNPPVSS